MPSSNMNSRTNNLLYTGYHQLHTRAPYDDEVPHIIHVSFISLRPGSTTGVLGPVDPFGSGSAYVPPFASPRFPSQPAMLNVARSTAMARNTRPEPRLTNYSEPLSTENEKNIGLEKLRREIYNPGIQQRSLYYRNYDYKSKSGDSEDSKKCVVCLEEFEPREMVTLTPCNHMFHDNCIVPWLKSHGQCPVCRFVISEGLRTVNHSELGNDPFARDLVSFIRGMEGRG